VSDGEDTGSIFFNSHAVINNNSRKDIYCTSDYRRRTVVENDKVVELRHNRLGCKES